MIQGLYNRRNFLTSISILSIGSAFSSPIKHFSSQDQMNDLKKKWARFWKKSGGVLFYDFNSRERFKIQNRLKGHYYKYGEPIHFKEENIIAEPAWIFWNNSDHPADVIVTLFQDKYPYKKIRTFNRYDMDALYRISELPCSEQLLLASFNNRTPIAGISSVIKTKTSIKRNSQVQDISYYKGQLLVFKDKIIYNT